MPVSGIHHIYIETHNWGRSVAFWQALGFRLEEDFGGSGILRGDAPGPYIFLEEAPPSKAPEIALIWNVTDATTFEPGPPAEISEGWTRTHWDTAWMTVTDPDGRRITLQDPTGSAAPS